MPSKRDPNKKSVSLYIPNEQKLEWEREAARRGMNLKSYVVFLVEEARIRAMKDKNKRGDKNEKKK